MESSNSTKTTLYTINEKRYTELVERVKKAGFSGQKITLIKTALSIYAFKCKQVWGLIESFTTESDKLEALALFKEHIVDIENKDKEIIEKFTFSDGKKKSAELLANVHNCKVEGEAPDKFPVIQLPYASKWADNDLAKVLDTIKKESFSDKKVAAAKEAFANKPEGLTPDQAEKLYDCFTFSKDILTVTELIHEKLMGITCEQIIKLLGKFSFQDQKLEILKAFKKCITDVDNKFLILDAYNFSDTKEEARKILEDLKPKSFIFGIPTGKVVFVIDLSGSMSCTFKLNTGKTYSRLDFVKMELEKVIHTFDEHTEFNILPYASGVSKWKNGLEKVTDKSVSEAIDYVHKFKANGGTNVYEALKTAYSISGVETIYFLTDGMPTEGAKQKTHDIVEEVKKWHASTKAKINSIAFLMGNFSGDNKPASRAFMRELAEVTGGTYRSIESD